MVESRSNVYRDALKKPKTIDKLENFSILEKPQWAISPEMDQEKQFHEL